MPTSPELWSVIIPLWTGAEGRSDLLLEATVEDRVEGPWRKSGASTSCELRARHGNNSSAAWSACGTAQGMIVVYRPRQPE